MVYACVMEQRRYFNIEADSDDRVMDWLQTHSMQDVDNLTNEYLDNYDERICDDDRSYPGLKAHFDIRKEKETVDDKLTRLQELINESLKLESDVKEKTKELNQEVANIKEDRFKKICDQIVELRDAGKGLGCLFVDTGISSKYGSENYWIRIMVDGPYMKEISVYSGKNKCYLNTILLTAAYVYNKNKISASQATHIDLDYIMDNWNSEVFEQNFIAAVHEALSDRAAKADEAYQNAKAKLEKETK